MSDDDGDGAVAGSGGEKRHLDHGNRQIPSPRQPHIPVVLIRSHASVPRVSEIADSGRFFVTRLGHRYRHLPPDSFHVPRKGPGSSLNFTFEYRTAFGNRFSSLTARQEKRPLKELRKEPKKASIHAEIRV
ncbi:hypothetical protein GWI33_016901 [Rhynchophorus ferrugineus]|uniref:Uncharacterized protein n=1 Tax=Rhynchophorus ferrugineus TaxID=354439 RepID=A0A834M2W5_RHYFE|nr:hypothetical protein GWI33_016901 [Rhynchophorus ferrugineus]